MSKSSFIGRSNELQTIKTIWGMARTGRPQVINIIADTGIGKTRLVQAFYEWLSTDAEQGNGVGCGRYWPVDLGSGRQQVVNPALDHFSNCAPKERRIPWLWWGLYWTDSDTGCALIRFENNLDVHLSVLEKKRGVQSKILGAVSDYVKDESLAAASDFVPFLRPALNFFRLGKIILEEKQEEEDAASGPGVGARKRRQAIAERVIERLSKALKFSEDQMPPAPMVLFLDDIHFAIEFSNDDFTLEFLDRLLRVSARERWPLLVITTHWKEAWKRYEKRDQTLKKGKPWHILVRELDANRAISAPVFHLLELGGMPAEDLGRIALERLPGLSKEDQGKILGRVDNVRWLVEVINGLEDNCENFDGYDRQRALSPYGRKNLERLLKSGGYLGVIRQRLSGDAMREVRAVLGATAWHANGLEFVHPLARAFGQELVELGALGRSDKDAGQQVLDIMVRAVDPSALLEGKITDRRLANLVRFPERGYLEIAKDMFDDRGLPRVRLALAQEIVIWMQKKETDKARWEQLPYKDQEVFLEIAMTVLGQLPSTAGQQLTEAPIWEAVAMAELVSMLHGLGDPRAWEVAIKLAERPRWREILPYTGFWEKLALVWVWKDIRACWSCARDLLDAEIELMSNGSREAGEANWLRYRAALLRARALLEDGAGEIDKARIDYECVLEIQEQVLTMQGEPDPIDLLDWSICLGEMAALDQARGDAERARKGYERSLKIQEHLRQRIDEASPEYTLVLRVQGVTLGKWGTLVRKAGMNDEAKNAYERSLEIQEQLLAEFYAGRWIPDVGVIRRDLTVTLGVIADLNRENGDLGDALTGYERCLEAREHLLETFGETPGRLEDVGMALSKLATAAYEIGKSDEALDGYTRSVNVREHLVETFGETPGRLEGLGTALMKLATVAFEIGKTDEALSGYTRSIAIRERLLSEQPPEKSESLRRLLNTYDTIGVVHLLSGQFNEARKIYERVKELQTQLWDEFGEAREPTSPWNLFS